MEHWLAMLVGVLVAAGSYLVLRADAFRRVLGFSLLGAGANLLLLTAGRFTPGRAPLVAPGQDALVGSFANPLAQALILTAIVIGFGLSAYLMALTRATQHEAAAPPPTDHIDRTDGDEASYLLDVDEAPPNLPHVAALANKKEDTENVQQETRRRVDPIRTDALEDHSRSVAVCGSE